MYGQEFGFYVEMDLDYLEENRRDDWEIGCCASDSAG